MTNGAVFGRGATYERDNVIPGLRVLSWWPRRASEKTTHRLAVGISYDGAAERPRSALASVFMMKS